MPFACSVGSYLFLAEASTVLDFFLPNKSLQRILGEDFLFLEQSRISSGKFLVEQRREARDTSAGKLHYGCGAEVASLL